MRTLAPLCIEDYATWADQREPMALKWWISRGRPDMKCILPFDHEGDHRWAPLQADEWPKTLCSREVQKMIEYANETSPLPARKAKAKGKRK